MKKTTFWFVSLAYFIAGFAFGCWSTHLQQAVNRAPQFAAQNEANESFDRGVIFGLTAYAEMNGGVTFQVTNVWTIMEKAEQLSREQPSDAMVRQKH